MIRASLVAQLALAHTGQTTKERVELGAVCRKFGVRVFAVHGKVLDGLALCGGTIAVNTDKPETRQRFTVAHELGHIILGHRGGCMVGGHGGGVHEKEANAFAGSLLIPRIALARVAHRYTLSQLAERFGVSQDCMSVRLRECGFSPKAD